MSKILKCKKCGDIIQSKHRHDMVWCKCHSIAIDGGDDYFRWAGNKDDIEFYVPESEKDERLAEQSDLIEHLKKQLNCDYYKPCPKCNNPYGASQFPSKDENGKEIYICSNCNEKELFYEPLIKQLEDQNDRLIKERDDANLKLSKLLQRVSEQNKELTDHKAKLAEKDRQILELQEQSIRDNQIYNEELVEKEKEIEQLKKFDDLNKTFFDLFRTAFKEPNKVDDLFNTLKTMQEKQDQDKISFCIEKLEKVKDYAQQIQGGLINYIDNQIKLLKECEK